MSLEKVKEGILALDEREFIFISRFINRLETIKEKERKESLVEILNTTLKGPVGWLFTREYLEDKFHLNRGDSLIG